MKIKAESGLTRKEKLIIPIKFVRGSERGSALIEFGFVIILLLTIMFAIIDFGRALYAYHFVANAAREGTRYAIVNGAVGCSASSSCSDIPGGVNTHVENLARGIGISDPGSVIAVTTPLIPANGGNNCATIPYNSGCIVQVQVTYPFKFIFPFLPQSTYTMTSSSQMVISQ